MPDRPASSASTYRPLYPEDWMPPQRHRMTDPRPTEKRMRSDSPDEVVRKRTKPICTEGLSHNGTSIDASSTSRFERSMHELLDWLPKISVQQIRLDEARERRATARKAYDKMAKYPDVYSVQTEVKLKRKDETESEVRQIEETMLSLRASALNAFQTLFDPSLGNGRVQAHLQDKATDAALEPTVRKTAEDVETLQASLKSVLAELETMKQRQNKQAPVDQTQTVTELDSLRSSMREQACKLNGMRAAFEERVKTMDKMMAKFEKDVQPLEDKLEAQIRKEVQILTTDAEAKEEIFGEEMARLEMALQAQNDAQKIFQDTTTARLDVAIHAANDLERRFNMIRTDEVVDSMARHVIPQLQNSYPVLHNLKTLQQVLDTLEKTKAHVDHSINGMRVKWEMRLKHLEHAQQRTEHVGNVSRQPSEQHQQEINGLHSQLKDSNNLIADLRRYIKVQFAEMGAMKCEINNLATKFGIGNGELPFLGDSIAQLEM